MDPDLFTPDRADQTGQIEQAKQVCRRCPIQQGCLEYGLRVDAAFGTQPSIWGGMSAEERRELADDTRAAS